jgi:hypothetical protein
MICLQQESNSAFCQTHELEVLAKVYQVSPYADMTHTPGFAW